MKILVTGGAGFIGSQLVKALLQQGEEIFVFDINPDPKLLAPIAHDIIYIRGDSASEADLYRSVLTSGAEAVIHLAAIMGGPSEENPPAALQVNFRSTQILLDACVTAGIKKMFYMSSSAVYRRDAPEPVPDDGPLGPSNIYGLSKAASELLCCWYAKANGIDCRGLRPTWVWGPHRKRGLTALRTNGLIDTFIAGGPVCIRDPDEKADWIYVHDLVKAAMLVWNAPVTARRFYTVCGELLTMRQVARVASRVFPHVSVTFGQGSTADSPYAAAFDDTPLRTEFGFKPEYTIERAMRDYASFKGAL